MSPNALPTSRLFVTQLLNSLAATSQAPSPSVQAASPLSHVSEKGRKRLLSLQVLFPNEFVPALDLLDRRLVARFRIRSSQDVDTTTAEARDDGVAGQSSDRQLQHVQSEATVTSAPQAPHQGEAERPHRIATDDGSADQTMTDAPVLEEDHNEYPTVYYVRSAQQRSSRYGTSFDTTTFYEVRLQAWNCSCPAFAFAAFPAMHPEPPVPVYDASLDYSVVENASSKGTGDSEWVFGGVTLGNNMPPVCKHLLACVLADKCSEVFGSFVEERIVSLHEAAGWAAGWGD